MSDDFYGNPDGSRVIERPFTDGITAWHSHTLPDVDAGPGSHVYPDDGCVTKHLDGSSEFVPAAPSDPAPHGAT